MTPCVEIWSRYLLKKVDPKAISNLHSYTWCEMSFFALSTTPGRTTVICFDAPDHFRSRLFAALKSASQSLNEPDIYQLHAYVIEQVLILYDDSVWAIRDVVRNAENVSGNATEESPLALKTNFRTDLDLIVLSPTSLCFMTLPDTQYMYRKP